MRVEMELKRIQHLQTSFQFQKMEDDFEKTNEKECYLCFYDLHMSATTCTCLLDRFACLRHGCSIDLNLDNIGSTKVENNEQFDNIG